VFVQALVQAAIVLMLAAVCASTRSTDEETPRYGPAAAATSAGVFLMLPYLSFRPVTFGFLILLVIARLLARGGRAVWWVVPLTVLYANVHLFVFFVPVMVLLDHRAVRLRRRFFLPRDREHDINGSGPFMSRGDENSHEKTRRQRRPGPSLAFVAATCFAAVATPMLPGLLRSVWNYSTHDAMVTGPVIAEMRGVAHGLASIPNVALLLGMAGGCFFARRPLPIGRVILIAMTAVLSFKIGRFVPLFVIVTAPAVAATLRGISGNAFARPVPRAAMSLVLVLILFKITVGFPTPRTSLDAWLNRHGPDAPGYPCAAADFVDRSVRRGTGRIVNEFSWGGYLAWRLGPKDRVLLDGRTQVFPPELWHATYLGTEQDRSRFLATVDADAAVLPAGHSQFRGALISLGWTPVYHDPRAEVLIPPAKLHGTPFAGQPAQGDTYASWR
jgi:hypothetical protein